MVRTVILIVMVCIVILFSSCEFFFVTPFPNNLTLFKESYVIPSSGKINDCRLYVINDFVFLNLHYDDNYKFYIFSPDLKLLYSDNSNSYCDTFALMDMNDEYIVGNNIYTGDLAGFTNPSGFSLNDSSGPEPPYGYGFSDGSYNYYVWWDEANNSISYELWNYDWTSYTPYSVPLSGYRSLKALYFDPDPVDPVVIMFFEMDDSESYDMEIAKVPAGLFAAGLSGSIYFPLYFYNYSVHISDIESHMCYYTGDGYVIERENGNLCRYNTYGKLVKEIGFIEQDQPEGYTQDGNTRYVFSRQYSRLMKTDTWW